MKGVPGDDVDDGDDEDAVDIKEVQPTVEDGIETVVDAKALEKSDADDEVLEAVVVIGDAEDDEMAELVVGPESRMNGVRRPEVVLSRSR